MSEVLYDVADHVATITLNAPERMNTISGAMLDDISVRLLQADRDRDVRCIILTGNGRAFCAGLDLAAQMSGPTGGLGNLGNLDTNPGEFDIREAPPIVPPVFTMPRRRASGRLMRSETTDQAPARGANSGADAPASEPPRPPGPGLNGRPS
jgi:hypothetical protein